MRGYFFPLVFGMLLLTYGELCAQPGFAEFYYCRAPLDPVLGCPCENADPFPDGAAACFFHDLDLNGPDDSDTLLLCSAFHYEANCWVPDFPLVISEPGAGMHVFLMVNGNECCWTTIDYVIVPGAQEIWIAGSDWSCQDTTCALPHFVPQVDVAFCYIDDGQGDPEPPLTDGTGQPLPDGTLVGVMSDLDAPGPDDSDSLLISLPMNGEIYGYGAGYFTSDPPAHVDSGSTVYLAIEVGDRCWHTVSYPIPLPPDTNICIPFGDWTATTPPCPWDSTQIAPDPTSLPSGFQISSIFPNPFNSKTQIELDLPQTGPVTVEIYNIAGQLVRTLAHDTFLAGVHRLTWDARSDANLPVGSGLYFCRAVSHGSSITKKLLLLQ